MMVILICWFIQSFRLPLNKRRYITSDQPILSRPKMAPQLALPWRAKMAPRCILALSEMAPRCIPVSKMVPQCI